MRVFNDNDDDDSDEQEGEDEDVNAVDEDNGNNPNSVFRKKPNKTKRTISKISYLMSLICRTGGEPSQNLEFNIDLKIFCKFLLSI